MEQPKKPASKEQTGPPVTEISCDSVMTAPLSPSGTTTATSSDVVRFQEQKTATMQSSWQLQSRREQFLQQTILLAGTSALAFFFFLWTILPLNALWAIATGFASMGLLLKVLYQQARLEFQALVEHGDGVGSFLTPTLRKLLLETTLHEYMCDPSFGLEYRHLALYFVPGISQEQLDAYVARLSPRHRRILTRKGLGHFLGEGFMRLLQGQQAQPSNPLASATTRTFVPHFDEDESADSDMHLVHAPDDGVSTEQQAVRALQMAEPHHVVSVAGESETMAVRAALPPCTPEDEQTPEHLDEEANVLVDAVSSAAYYISTTIWDYTGGYYLEKASKVATKASAAVTLSAGAFAAFGFWKGVYGLNSFRGGASSRAVAGYPTFGIVLFTMAAGVASTGMSMLVQSHLCGLAPQSPPPASASNDSKKTS